MTSSSRRGATVRIVSVCPLTLGSANIIEYVADLADQRKLGANGNRYTGANNIERFMARGNAQAVC